MAKLLIISTQLPYYSSHAQDAIEAALAASNVGVEVSFVFMNEGVYQLLNAQNNGIIEKKSILKQIKAFPLYDIDDICYVEKDIIDRSILPESLSDVACAISIERFQRLCASADAVLRF